MPLPLASAPASALLAVFPVALPLSFLVTLAVPFTVTIPVILDALSLLPRLFLLTFPIFVGIYRGGSASFMDRDVPLGVLI